jgi:ribose transport system substrate-binding protein
MRKSSFSLRCAGAAGIATVVLLTATGCGSDDKSSDTSSSSTAAAAPIAATPPAAATTGSMPSLAQLTGKGSETSPPATSPPPAKGKSVWWISCGQSVPDCSVPAANAKEAAEKLGINFRIADGQLNANGGDTQAMRTALAANPDAIVVHGIACDAIRAPLLEAKSRKIPVLPVEALDCNSGGGGNQLFTADMKYGAKDPTVQDYFRAWGTNIAENMAAMTDGKAKAINNAGSYDLMALVNTGFVNGLKPCASCQIVNTTTFEQAEQVPNGPWIQRFRTALVKDPDANAVNFAAGINVASLGGARAAHEANPNIQSFSGTGLAPDLDLVRQGLVSAVTAHSSEWMGYGAMDNINRVLDGKPTVPQGIGFRTVTKDANLPPKPGTSYQTPIDFKGIYDKSWSKAAQQ